MTPKPPFLYGPVRQVGSHKRSFFAILDLVRSRQTSRRIRQAGVPTRCRGPSFPISFLGLLGTHRHLAATPGARRNTFGPRALWTRTHKIESGHAEVQTHDTQPPNVGNRNRAHKTAIGGWSRGPAGSPRTSCATNPIPPNSVQGMEKVQNAKSFQSLIL